LTGMPVNGPATKSLAGYPVLVRENQISLVVPPNDRSQAERKVESPR
jgi:hypothetical protein